MGDGADREATAIPREKRSAGTRLPWHGGAAPASSFPHGFLLGPVTQVARELLGARLTSTVGGERTVGVIVECEAYGGLDDPASHAATRKGITARNRTMFGPAGRAYVYRSYGVHWCVNVVTGRPNDPQAVLLRGLEPLEGEDIMAFRRGARTPTAAGPGRLCQALGVDGTMDGHDLRRSPLMLEPGWHVPDELVGVSARIGVRLAAERPNRFFVRDSPGVTP